jgi:Pyruvate/2-oxoacid:ferredoxin oxidoreductase delta subunit
MKKSFAEIFAELNAFAERLGWNKKRTEARQPLRIVIVPKEKEAPPRWIDGPTPGGERQRRCTRCEQYLPPSAFPKSAHSSDNLHYYCRLCAVATNHIHRKKV